jgi:DNA-binding NarL/FixJ family response regulator
MTSVFVDLAGGRPECDFRLALGAAGLWEDEARADVAVVDAADTAVIERLARRLPVVAVGADDAEVFLSAIRAGATSYVTDRATGATIADAALATAVGRPVLPSRLALRLLEEFRACERRARLTRREQTVLRLLAEGLTTKEAALQLAVTPTTVRRHISDAVRRLGATGREDVIRVFKNSERE